MQNHYNYFRLKTQDQRTSCSVGPGGFREITSRLAGIIRGGKGDRDRLVILWLKAWAKGQ